MYVFISVIILIAAVFLTLIVLIQNSKGGGLASGFSSSNQIMGVRKTTDFLEKATWGAAGTIVVLCIVISAFLPKHERVDQSEIQQLVNEAPFINPNASPDFGTAQPGLPATLTPEATPAPEEEQPAN